MTNGDEITGDVIIYRFPPEVVQAANSAEENRRRFQCHVVSIIAFGGDRISDSPVSITVPSTVVRRIPV